MVKPSPHKPHLVHPVLLVDDEQDNLDAFCFNFKGSFHLHTALSGAEGLELLEHHDVAVIITDQRMPRMSGTEFLRRARDLRPDAVGIILTAFRDEDVLIEAIKLGHVYRYVLKPWDRDEMQAIVSQALERFHLRRENERLTARLRQYTGYLESERHGAFDYGQIIGDAPSLRKVLHQVEQVAPTASTVLLRGETGTGKELLAHAIHINSPREGRPFVKVNCAALAPGVLESELFGHEKGSFTGAVTRRMGRFELADGGTLFLDEVGDLPPEVQIKLLRVLQEREFERIGGPETVRVDVRLISATNRNLEELISRGAFRRDLYYRLNVFPVVIPPLRERKEDIPALTRHFLEKFSPTIGKQVHDISPSALDKLLSYDWPGNVRELENVMERALILCQGERVRALDLDFGPISTLPTEPLTGELGGGPQPSPAAPVLQTPAYAPAPPHPTDASPPHTQTVRSLAERLGEEERAQIAEALERSAGNVAAAARSLGINRSTLYYRMRKHGLENLVPTRR